MKADDALTRKEAEMGKLTREHILAAARIAERESADALESVREEALEERFWVVEAVNEDDTALSPPGYWYGGFVGSTVAGHVGSDIHALCTRFQNAQTAEYVKCLLRNAKIKPDRGHHWKIFKHAIALQHAPARVAEVPEGEQCWLIERTYAKGQPAERREFWLGITPGDVHRDSFDSNNELWTTNALEAARFSSLYIAKVLCYRHFHPESTVEACEHRLLKLGQEKPTHFRWGNGGMVADPKGGYVWVGPPPPGRL